LLTVETSDTLAANALTSPASRLKHSPYNCALLTNSTHSG
jgi:hypothetical protein